MLSITKTCCVVGFRAEHVNNTFLQGHLIIPFHFVDDPMTTEAQDLNIEIKYN